MTNEHETNLLKVLVTELDDRSGLIDPIRRHYQRALVQRVEVAHDQHEVARLLHGEEPRARDVDDEAVLEDDIFAAQREVDLVEHLNRNCLSFEVHMETSDVLFSDLRQCFDFKSVG